MALSIKPAPAGALKGPVRGQRSRSFQLLPDASKPAAGYTVLASDLGFSTLDFVLPGGVADTTLRAHAVIGTAQSDFTINWYVNSLHTATSNLSAASVGVALGASNTSVTTNPVYVFVIGR